MDRGHSVLVFEATTEPDGQVRLVAQSPRRREMISIIDWRMEQCKKGEVEFHFNTLAEMDDILAQSPDVVIVATGGLPHTELLDAGNDLVESSWDIISRSVQPGTMFWFMTTRETVLDCKPQKLLKKMGPKLK